MSMPRNERKEDAFLSPAVETYAYRYVTLPYSSVGGRRKWCCCTAVSEGDENGVALGSSISQQATCHSGIIVSPKTIKEDTLNIDL
jgi:hypothetical protein